MICNSQFSVKNKTRIGRYFIDPCIPLPVRAASVLHSHRHTNTVTILTIRGPAFSFYPIIARCSATWSNHNGNKYPLFILIRSTTCSLCRQLWWLQLMIQSTLAWQHKYWLPLKITKLISARLELVFMSQVDTDTSENHRQSSSPTTPIGSRSNMAMVSQNEASGYGWIQAAGLIT